MFVPPGRILLGILEMTMHHMEAARSLTVTHAARTRSAAKPAATGRQRKNYS